MALLERQIVGHVFHDVLAIVEHAFDGDVVDVLVHQAEHLRLLKRAHAAMGAEHEHAHAFFAAHGVFGRAAGVAAGGAQDVELFAAAGQLVFKQVAQQLHGHVLEGQRGAVGQGFEVKAVVELFERHDGGVAVHRFGVGLVAERLQVGRGNVVDVERQHFKRQRRVTAAACPR